MRLQHLYRWLAVALTGGMLLQTTSCTYQFASAVADTITISLGTILETQISTFFEQLFGATS
jgi:hypothetical protein